MLLLTNEFDLFENALITCETIQSKRCMAWGDLNCRWVGRRADEENVFIMLNDFPLKIKNSDYDGKLAFDTFDFERVHEYRSDRVYMPLWTTQWRPPFFPWQSPDYSKL